MRWMVMLTLLFCGCAAVTDEDGTRVPDFEASTDLVPCIVAVDASASAYSEHVHATTRRGLLKTFHEWGGDCTSVTVLQFTDRVSLVFRERFHRFLPLPPSRWCKGQTRSVAGVLNPELGERLRRNSSVECTAHYQEAVAGILKDSEPALAVQPEYDTTTDLVALWSVAATYQRVIVVSDGIHNAETELPETIRLAGQAWLVLLPGNYEGHTPTHSLAWAATWKRLVPDLQVVSYADLRAGAFAHE